MTRDVPPIAFSQKLAELSNDMLLRIVTVDADDYLDEAIEAAKKELQRRGQNAIPGAAIKRPEESKTYSRTRLWVQVGALLFAILFAFECL